MVFGLPPMTSSSPAQSSGTSPSPSSLAASAGNALRRSRVDVKMMDTSWSCSTPLRSSRADSSSPVRPMTASLVSASTVVAPRNATSRSPPTGPSLPTGRSPVTIGLRAPADDEHAPPDLQPSADDERAPPDPPAPGHDERAPADPPAAAEDERAPADPANPGARWVLPPSLSLYRQRGKSMNRGIPS